MRVSRGKGKVMCAYRGPGLPSILRFGDVLCAKVAAGRVDAVVP